MTEAPLAGLRVLDFSRVLAGPYAGRMLSDLGADVVKVEPPEGDVSRLWGRRAAGLASYYVQQNAGKRNVCLDLQRPEAVGLARRLAAAADVVVENFRPDVMGRLGLGWERLSADNPRLVMLSISGFGGSGPEARRPAYAPIVHAELGLMERQARLSGARPTDLPLSVADTNAGLHGLVGLLAALLMRERTGRGQHIDLAMMDATLSTDDQLHLDLDPSEDPRPLPSEVWPTGAGDIFISADFRHLWRRMTETLGVVDPTPAGAALEAKIAGRRAAAAAAFAALGDFAAVEAAFHRMNIAWGRVRRSADLAEQPTLRHRGSIVQVDDRAGGTRPVVQSPWRLSGARTGVRGGAPFRGEHNREVLADWLGAGAAEAAALEASGALQLETPAGAEAASGG